MRKMLASIAASALVLGVGGGLAASVATPGPASASVAHPSSAALKAEAVAKFGAAKDSKESKFLAHLSPNSVTIGSNICSGNVGGSCWWESAIQFWYDMKQGTNESSNLASVYTEYSGNSHPSTAFLDGWSDDNAWWGITWQLANQLYGTANYLTTATAAWTWDTTSPSPATGTNGGWDTACGGSPYQWNVSGGPPGHSGQQFGSQDDIARATLGELAHALGKTSSAQNAADWLYANMQGSNTNAAPAENLNPGTCTAQGTAEEGGAAETWKVENVTTSPGQPGAKASAVAQNPDPIDNSMFDELFTQYGL